jgi:hypothetical protein
MISRYLIWSGKHSRWIVTGSVPLCLFLALISWPSYLCAASLFVTGCNFTMAVLMWRPARIPFRLLPLTPADLAEMDRQLRAAVAPMLDRIAQENGFEPEKERPTTRH